MQLLGFFSNIVGSLPYNTKYFEANVVLNWCCANKIKLNKGAA